MFEFSVSMDMKSMLHGKGVVVWKVTAHLCLDYQGIEKLMLSRVRW